MLLVSGCLRTGGSSMLTYLGIVGMQDPPNSTFGLVGVAPEADIGMYRKLTKLFLFTCGCLIVYQVSLVVLEVQLVTS
jgi:hypothetical protein